MSLKSDLKFYIDLDELPIKNWINIHKNSSLKYIIKNIDYDEFEITEEIEEIINEKWVILYDDYIDNYGLNKKYKRVLELERRIALLKCDMWIKENKFLKNEIRINEKKLLKEQTKNTIDKKGNDFTKQIVVIEKWLGSIIDIDKLSTKKYLTYLQMLEEESDRIEKMKDKKNG